MAYGNLHTANFQRHLAPTNVGGIGLIPVQQAAMAIIQERKDERRKERLGLTSPGDIHRQGGYAEWERRYRLVNTLEKRCERGGSTMRPQDALVNSPRGKWPISLTEMDL
jgi:hypothetical protein